MNQILLDTKINSWINNYNSEKTKEAALTSYKALLGYLERSSQNESEWIDKMQKTDDSKYHLLSEMVNEISNMIEPASLKQYYNFWKAYLRFVYGIKIYNEDAKYFIKPPKNIKRIREPLTKETIKQICKNSDDIRRAEYLVLSSSGMRMSEFLNSEKENFDLDTGIVDIVGKLTKTKVERKTFISKEAIKAIEKTGESFWDKRSYHMEATYFHRLREKIDLTERYDGSIVHKITLHSFRSFTRTQAGKINADFAEQLIGHKRYVRLTEEEMLENYKKLEPKIRIF